MISHIFTTHFYTSYHSPTCTHSRSDPTTHIHSDISVSTHTHKHVCSNTLVGHAQNAHPHTLALGILVTLCLVYKWIKFDIILVQPHGCKCRMTLFQSLDASHTISPLDITSEDIRTAFSWATPGSIIMASSKPHVSYMYRQDIFCLILRQVYCILISYLVLPYVRKTKVTVILRRVWQVVTYRKFVAWIIPIETYWYSLVTEGIMWITWSHEVKIWTIHKIRFNEYHTRFMARFEP